ncbi:MAG: hypothetical protein E6Q93_16105 [Burkholderiaceae bacterium]|nr:MAG: hypothetical protein E6Q93_16105 [Burkholderiaceae bacterium]
MTHTRSISFAFAIVIAASLHAPPASAVALRLNKATDDSVCDLTHDTNYVLGQRTLVPAVASSKDQIDAFFRLAGEFVATKCRNGQMLMLQGSSSLNTDVRSLTAVAEASCAIASITRTETTIAYGDRALPAFDLRCTILKHDELVSKLNELEKTDPMESLKARMAEAVRKAEGSAPTGPNAASKKDCGKVTLATILGGGSCK